jgi:hypothetical protein
VTLAGAGGAKAITARGFLFSEAREHEASQRSFEEVQALWQRLNQPFGESVALLNLVWTAVCRHHAQDARRHLVSALELVPRIDSRYIGQNLIDMACALAAAEDEAMLALTLRSASIHQRAQIKMPFDLDPEHAVHLERARSRLGAEELLQGERDGRSMGYEQALQRVRARLKPPVRSDA